MIDLANASRSEMMHYAKNVLKLSVSPNIGDETLRERIDEHVAGLKQSGPQRVEAHDDGDEYVKILIAESEKDKEPVPIGVNGTVCLVKRGQVAEIRKKYARVLANAIEDKFDPQTMTSRQVPAYPFTLIEGTL